MEGTIALVIASIPPAAFNENNALCRESVQALVEICIIGASIMINGEPFMLSKREKELFIYLAVKRGAHSTEEIAEALWNGRTVRATGVVRVYINRLRTRVGDASIIVRVAGGYALSSRAHTDLQRIEQRLASWKIGATVTSSEYTQAELDLRALNQFSLRTRASDSFPALQLQIDELTREVALILGRHALANGLHGRAKLLAELMIKHDSCDEPARELLIRAYLLEGDHSAAIRAFRIYRDTLYLRLHTQPSRSLQTLIEDFATSAPALVS